jgi:hypothetical protein
MGRLDYMPLAFEARLPPLHPKRAAQLLMLAASGGSLFAGEERPVVVPWGWGRGALARAPLSRDSCAVEPRRRAGRVRQEDCPPEAPQAHASLGFVSG